jgi:hypothetical protein
VFDAIRKDAKDTLVHEETTIAYRSVTVPISLLPAERGMLDEPTGLYGHLQKAKSFQLGDELTIATEVNARYPDGECAVDEPEVIVDE